jgi:hypothetical protein
MGHLLWKRGTTGKTRKPFRIELFETTIPGHFALACTRARAKVAERSPFPRSKLAGGGTGNPDSRLSRVIGSHREKIRP